MKNSISRNTRGNKIVFLLMGVIGLIGIGYYYFTSDHRSGSLYLSLGFSLLLVDLIYIGFTLSKPNEVNEQLDHNYREEENKKYIAEISEPLESISRNEEVYSEPGESSVRPASPHDDHQPKEDATILLGGEEPERNKPLSIRFVNGEIVKVNQERFRIGRDPDAVSYVVEAVGVSRIHMELIQLNDGGYGIQDVHSSNGTIVNGTKIEPHHIYKVNDQDHIMIGRAAFYIQLGEDVG
ncbi:MULTISPECIES: FHA domain-containing protein [Pontibacillus]|uniref:FHA domain-containing protein n=1 Tax=Pontibacillus chungwhensis TaxID=265426 RepID=A0ABY8UVQ5_9BACI|nr:MULTISPECIES: FHA domain-containing protein [Pontibacillus]MCD5324186.1 FHA domain-containing protein [Pontibacillus sp. HN14]WIF97755.1 FHA domain-containing protein [Pontibacillus chungwhensis]